MIVMMFMLMTVVIVIMIVVVMMMFVFVLLVNALFVSLCPACGSNSFFKIIGLCVEDIGNSNFAVVGFDYLSLRLKRPYHSLDSAKLVGSYLVYLVEDNSRAEFYLLNEKVRNVLFADVISEKIITAAEFARHSECINNRNYVVKTADSRVTLVYLALKNRNGLCDRERLTNTACLDKNIVELARFDKVCDLIHQIDLKCAADTAVGKRNEVVVLLCNSAALLDKLRINVYFADIVDDNSGFITLLIVQNVVDKCSFSCAEVTCEKCDRHEWSFCHIYHPFRIFFVQIIFYHKG